MTFPQQVIGRKSSTSKTPASKAPSTVGKDTPPTGPSSSDRDERSKEKTKYKKGLHKQEQGVWRSKGRTSADGPLQGKHEGVGFIRHGDEP
jgi:hypothetical protein